jgi:hypothetical protein
MAYDNTSVGYGAAGIARDRIAQALLNVQNPPPRSQVPPMMGGGAPQMGPTSSMRPGAMPQVATGIPGVPGASGVMPGGMPGAVPGAVPPISSVAGMGAVPPMTGMPGVPAVAGPGGATTAMPPAPIGQQY